MNENKEIKKFEIGKEYSTRSICDYNCIFSYVIISRTAKTVTIKLNGEIVKRKIAIRDGVETISPQGVYSMSPTLKAA